MSCRKPYYLAILALALTFLGCSGVLDQEQGEPEASGPSLQLVWPEGYSFDSSSARLNSPSAENELTSPVYVLGVTLTITGPDMEPVVLDVPLDTLHVVVVLAAGEYTFDVLVKTDTDATFTGRLTTEITPVAIPVLVIPLEVNSPPSIDSVEIVPPNPQVGDTVTITATVSDLDPDDILTLRWEGIDPQGRKDVITGPSASNTFDFGGTYKLSLIVDDGHGGVTIRTTYITIANDAPVIGTINLSDPNPSPGDTITVSVTASDPDGHAIRYEWYDNQGWEDTGPSVSYTVPNTNVPITLLVAVIDEYGAHSEKKIALNVNAAVCGMLADPVVSAIPFGTLVTLSWSAVTSATDYYVYRNINVGSPPTPGVDTVFATVTAPTTSSPSYVMSSGDEHSVVVTAVNGGCERYPNPLNDQKQMYLATPASLNAVSGGTGVTDLSWIDGTAGVTWDIHYNTTGSVTTGDPFVGVGSSPYSFNCTSSVTYYYRVRSKKSTYASGLSAETSYLCP